MKLDAMPNAAWRSSLPLPRAGEGGGEGLRRALNSPLTPALSRTREREQFHVSISCAANGAQRNGARP